jgi:hypothetical protein
LRAAIPVLAFLAIHGWAWGQGDPTAAAEGRHLAFLAGWLLACAAVLVSPREGRALALLGLLATLVVAAAWVMPGPTRGAAVLMLLLVAVGGAAHRRLGALSPAEALPWPAALALALAAQAFFRGDRFLLEPASTLTGASLASLVTLVGLPLLAGNAMVLLSRHRGWAPALLAGSACAVATPGWTVLSALGLLAIAAGVEAASRRGLPAAGVVVLAAVAASAGRQEAAIAVLGLGAVSYLMVDSRRRRWALGLLAVLWLAVLVLPDAGHVPAEAAAAVAVFVVLAPGVLLLLAERAGVWAAMVAALVTGVGLPFLPAVPVAAVVALAVALLWAGMPASPPSRTAALALEIQRDWYRVLVPALALLAAYPWMRGEPLLELWRRDGALAGGGWWLPFAGMVGAAVLGASVPALRWLRWGALLLGLCLVLPLPRGTGTVLLTGESVTLTAAAPEWVVACPEGALKGLVLDSSIAHGASLEAGTAVARVETAEEVGELRLGMETGEWAARRPGVMTAAPPAWLATVAPGGSFFAQRYRSRFALEGEACRKLQVRRDPRLPEAVTVTLFFAEVHHGE